MAEQPKARIALVDDEPVRLSIAQMFRLRGYAVEVFNGAETALAWPGLRDVDCVVTDVKMPGMSGEELLKEIMRRAMPLPVIMITGHGDVSMAVRCLKEGAYDFVEKPFDEEVLLASVARAVEKTMLRKEAAELRRRLDAPDRVDEGRFGMIGLSGPMQDVYAQIEVAARSDAPVLIQGETGVGKELVARAIHAQSRRASGPFVPVNAGALPESTLESELFGHARGAFTGADSARAGKLVTASGGTLMLDEVESLAVRAQVQLLRVLEDGLVVPLGKDAPRKVDIRLLATTKVDLQDAARAGRMREDFLHRIVVLRVNVPPLRDRPEDIVPLVSFFMRRAAELNNVSIPEAREESLAEMTAYGWPGNVRELKNAVERMVITAHDGIAGPFRAESPAEGERLLSVPATAGVLRDAMERTERSVVESSLREHEGDVSATAAAIGVSRRALYDRMKKYGLNPQDFRR